MFQNEYVSRPDDEGRNQYLLLVHLMHQWPQPQEELEEVSGGVAGDSERGTGGGGAALVAALARPPVPVHLLKDGT